MFPQNKFQKSISYAFERMLPTLTYFSWKPIMEGARASGWTVQERFFFNFFRSPTYHYHIFGQYFHPYGYLERQRADQFIRRVQTILPGCEAPDWAHNNRRVPDFDFDAVDLWNKALMETHRESTPKPHANYPNYFAIGHYYNQRFQLGKWAARLFYNETVKGDSVNTGYYTKIDHEIMDSWYAGGDNTIHKINRMSEEERQELSKNADRWLKLIDEFFPEFKNIHVKKPVLKYEEPYFERNMADVRNAVFAEHLLRALQSKALSENELEELASFFTQQNDSAFWEQDEDGQYKPTELYLKFVKALNLPNIFKDLNKMSGRLLEDQYNDVCDRNWGINYHTVDAFRNRTLDLLENLNSNKQNYNNKELSAIRQLVLEEVYNPFFRSSLNSQYKLKEGDNKQSLVLNALNNGAKYSDLNDLVTNSRDQFSWIMSKSVKEQFDHRMRNVAKTIPFNAQAINGIKN
jgi:hypothetical protein